MTIASVKKDLKAFDRIGLTSFVVFFTLILVAISMGGVIYLWGDWKIITIFAIGFVSAFAFTVYEAFVPEIRSWHSPSSTTLPSLLPFSEPSLTDIFSGRYCSTYRSTKRL
jgi:hypothetical protein